MKTEVLSYRVNVLPGQELELKERIKDNGRVSEIRIRFYPGQERQLRVRPFILHTNNRAENILTFVDTTETYLTGDNDYFVFPVSSELFLDDEFVVWTKNDNDLYVYTVVVDVVINYLEGF